MGENVVEDLRSLFFWDVTLCHSVIGSRRFDTTDYSGRQGSECPGRFLGIKYGVH